MKSRFCFLPSVLVLTILFTGPVVLAQSSSFTYQGRLTDGGAAANGNYDLQFALWDSASSGTQIGSTLTLNSVAVSNGVFSVSLDFGAGSFNGANRFLEISARPVSGGAFTLLAPRQQVTSTPYAIRSANASSADAANIATNATQLGGVASSQYVQTGDSRLSDARTPAPGSANYIQNTSGAQTANFNINGNGTIGGLLSGNVVNAIAQYNLNGSSILSSTPASGSINTALGFQTGSINAGVGNTMLGFNTGNANVSGIENVFIGTSAGASNTTGGFNTFVGIATGFFNTTGSNNAIFGANTGARVTTASSNSFFGGGAGADVTTGGQNTFIGAGAGGIIRDE